MTFTKVAALGLLIRFARMTASPPTHTPNPEQSVKLVNTGRLGRAEIARQRYPELRRPSSSAKKRVGKVVGVPSAKLGSPRQCPSPRRDVLARRPEARQAVPG